MNRLRRMMALALALALMAVVLLPAASFAKSDLHKGSRGDEVKALQEQLNALGFDVGKPDGDFGGKTETALKQFQESKELEATGRLDADTYRALFGKEPPMEVWERPREPETGIHRYDYFISDCDWEEANRRAVDMGGWLVGINSMSEYIEIQSEIVELGYSDVSFWIGVRRDLDQSPGGFYWSDEYGGNYETPIDGRETLGGVNPWALGEPSYVSAEGEQELYTRLRFSEGEARWVWDNCDGVPAKDKRQGYIVEYPEKSAVATAEMVRGQVTPEQTPVLAVRQEPEPRPRPEAAAEYSAKLLQVAGGNLIFLVSTVDKCAMYVEYYNNGRQLYWQWNTVDGGLTNRVIHMPIAEDAYDYLTPLFTVKYQLVAYDPDADDIGGAFIDKQEYALPEAMDIEPVDGDPTLAPEAMETWGSGNGEMEQETAQRVTVERQSDPTRRDSEDEVQILDADTEDPVVLVNPNIPFYLPPGTYVIHDPNDPDSDTIFTVLDSPVRPVIRDMEPGTLEGTLVDAATGQPLAGVTVTVEVQGITYTTVTDENGHFSFNNLVPVDAMLTVSCEGYASVTRMFTIGSGMNAPLDIECEAYPKATFFGYWHDGKAECDAAVQANWDHDGWWMGKSMYIEVAESISGDGAASGAVFNCTGDGPRPFIEVSHEQAKSEFFDGLNFKVDGDVSELLVISGTIRKDNTKANNPGYNYIFEGFSDMLIDIDTMEPVSDAGRRILEQCRENGTNPLEDETLRAIIASKYDDEAAAQAALAELAEAEPEARDKQLEKLLK